MFNPDWRTLIALAVTFAVAWVARGALAGHRQMVSNAHWREQLHGQQVSLAIWLIHLFGGQHGLNERYAAKNAANRNAALGPGLAESFDLAWNPHAARWYVPRPRQAEEPEPRVDLRITVEADDLASGPLRVAAARLPEPQVDPSEQAGEPAQVGSA